MKENSKENKKFKLSEYLSSLLGDSFLSRFLLGYEKLAQMFLSCGIYTVISKLIVGFSGFRYFKIAFSRSCEKSRIITFFNTISVKSFEKTLRYYGAAMFFFGIFAVSFSSIREFTLLNRIPYYQIHIGDTVLLGLICIFLSVLLMTSGKSLASQVCDSRILSFLLFDILSFDKKEFQKIKAVQRSYTWPVIIGMAAAIVVTFISLSGVMSVIISLALITVVMRSPESGVITTLLFLPFLPNNALIFTVSLVCISFILKCLRNKRLMKIGFIDVLFVLLSIVILLSGFISISSETSAVTSIIFVEFIFFGFVIVNCIKTSSLVKKCIQALLVSASVVSFASIAIYFIDLYKLYEISFVFKSFRYIFSVIPFGNSDAYYELTALAVPIAFADLFGRGLNLKKRYSFFAFFLIALSIILSFDFSLWIMLLSSLIIYIILLHPKFIYAVLTVVISLVSLNFVFPDLFSRLFEIVKSYTSFDEIYHEFVRMEEFAYRLAEEYNFAGLSTSQVAIERASSEMFGVATKGMFGMCSGLLKLILSVGLPGVVVAFLIFIFYSSFAISFIAGNRRRSKGLRKIVAVILASIGGMVIRGVFFSSMFSCQSVLALIVFIYLGIASGKCAKSEYVPELYERQIYDGGGSAGGAL